MTVPKFRFFGKVADGQMRMVLAEAIDFTTGFVYYSYHDYTVEGGDNVYGDTISFENCVLIQSTGLKDKNDKEIYEGDVVHAYSEGARLIGVIEYFDNAYCIKDKNGIYNSLWTNAEQYEIIGDIYRNPELVEGE